MTDVLLEWQRQFYTGLSAALRAAHGLDGGTVLAALAGFAFLFGVFHVLLPGHQKTVLSAYFVSENANYAQGFLAGGLFAVFHGASATVFPLALKLGLGLALGRTNQLALQVTQLVAFWGILTVASVLLILRLRRIPELRRRSDLARVRRQLGFDLHDRIETSYEPVPWRRLLPFLFFAAVLPCPDTLIFLLALVQGNLGPGLVAVGAMTLGMASTLTILALAVIAAKRSGRGLTRSSGGWAGVFAVEVLSLVVLVIFALLLFPQGPVAAFG